MGAVYHSSGSKSKNPPKELWEFAWKKGDYDKDLIVKHAIRQYGEYIIPIERKLTCIGYGMGRVNVSL